MLQTIQKPEKSEQEQFYDKWVARHDLPWLFPDHAILSSQDYIEHFHHLDGPLLINRCPLLYTFDVLEKYKDNVVFSNHIVNGAEVSPYTIFQIDRNTHVIADWVWIEEHGDFFVYLTVFYRRNAFYIGFLKEIEDFRFFQEQKSFGFGVNTSHGQS